MMFASAATEAALLIVVIAGAVGVVGATVATIISVLAQSRRESKLFDQIEIVRVGVGGVQDELRTLNGLTVGNLADAEESRRVHAIPKPDRTDQEQEHLDVVPDEIPSKGDEGGTAPNSDSLASPTTG